MTIWQKAAVVWLFRQNSVLFWFGFFSRSHYRTLGLKVTTVSQKKFRGLLMLNSDGVLEDTVRSGSFVCRGQTGSICSTVSSLTPACPHLFPAPAHITALWSLADSAGEASWWHTGDDRRNTEQSRYDFHRQPLTEKGDFNSSALNNSRNDFTVPEWQRATCSSFVTRLGRDARHRAKISPGI